MKTEVYSWRLSTDLKTHLEHEARRRKVSLSALLDLAARDWLNKSEADGGDKEQLRLHRAASQSFGAFAGTDARRSEDVRKTLRRRMRSQHAR